LAGPLRFRRRLIHGSTTPTHGSCPGQCPRSKSRRKLKPGPNSAPGLRQAHGEFRTWP
jgi:hypothetical protein